eukprot:1031395-Prorocentrum_lima.AAC.1
MSNILCGMSGGQQYPEGAHERSRRAIRNVGLWCFPLFIAYDKLAEECNWDQQGSGQIVSRRCSI